MGWFKEKAVEVVKIVEVEKPRAVAELDKSSRDAVTTLGGHPGFQYLLAKLKYQRSALETQLKYNRHDDIRQVDFLQSGIYWAKWLETQLSTEVLKQKPTVVTDVTQQEFEALREKAPIELVGV